MTGRHTFPAMRVVSLSLSLQKAKTDLFYRRCRRRREPILTIREHHIGNLRGWRWAAEIISLRLIAVGRVQKRSLPGGLHAFDSHPHIKFAPESDYRFDNRLSIAS